MVEAVVLLYTKKIALIMQLYPLNKMCVCVCVPHNVEWKTNFKYNPRREIAKYHLINFTI